MENELRNLMVMKRIDSDVDCCSKVLLGKVLDEGITKDFPFYGVGLNFGDFKV